MKTPSFRVCFTNCLEIIGLKMILGFLFLKLWSYKCWLFLKVIVERFSVTETTKNKGNVSVISIHWNVFSLCIHHFSPQNLQLSWLSNSLVLTGGAGVCPTERPCVQQGQPHFSPLEDQRQEVWTDFSEPSWRPSVRSGDSSSHWRYQPRYEFV